MGRRSGTAVSIALVAWLLVSMVATPVEAWPFDPSPNAAGIQVMTGTVRPVDRPTTNGRPHTCAFPCASGWRVVDSIASIRATISPGDSTVVTARALSVTAQENYCEWTGDPSELGTTIRCTNGRAANAFAEGVDIGIDPEAQDHQASLVTAHGVATRCTRPNSGTASGMTDVAGLYIDGVGFPLPEVIPQNLYIPLADGYLLVNEHTQSHGGIGAISINALHLYMPGYDVIVAHTTC